MAALNPKAATPRDVKPGWVRVVWPQDEATDLIKGMAAYYGDEVDHPGYRAGGGMGH